MAFSNDDTEMELQAVFQTDEAAVKGCESSWSKMLQSMRSVGSSAMLQASLGLLESSIATMTISDNSLQSPRNTKSFHFDADSPTSSSSSEFDSPAPISPPHESTDPFPPQQTPKKDNRNFTTPSYDGSIGLDLLKSAAAQQYDNAIFSRPDFPKPHMLFDVDDTEEQNSGTTDGIIGRQTSTVKVEHDGRALAKSEETGDPSRHIDTKMSRYDKNRSQPSLSISDHHGSAINLKYALRTPSASPPVAIRNPSPPRQHYGSGVDTERAHQQPPSTPTPKRTALEDNTPDMTPSSPGLHLLVAAVACESDHQQRVASSTPRTSSYSPLHPRPKVSLAVNSPPFGPNLSKIYATSRSLQIKNSKAKVPEIVTEGIEIIPGTDFPCTTKSKGKSFPPLKPLSAYNFFFRDERDRILAGIRDEELKELLSEERRHKLLWDHWTRDRTKKRAHRKSHGKVSFQELSKLISTRWKGLPGSEQEYYRQVAVEDLARFKLESKLNKETPSY